MTTPSNNAEDRRTTEARVDAIGWGILLVGVGAVLLVPGLPGEAWLVAAGAVMLGTSVARAMLDLPVIGTTTILGLAALVGGAAGLAGLEGAAWPLVLVAVGLAIIGLTFLPRHLRVTQRTPDSTWR